jgi:hypothetical protein
MVKADAVVHRSLAERADGQRAPEATAEEAHHARQVGEGKGRCPVEANEDARGHVAAGGQRRLRQLGVQGGLPEHRLADVVGVLDPPVGLLDLSVGLSEELFGDLDIAARDDPPLKEVAPDLDHLSEAVGLLLVCRAHALEAGHVLPRCADDHGSQAVGLGLPPGRDRRTRRRGRDTALRGGRRRVEDHDEEKAEREGRRRHHLIVARRFNPWSYSRLGKICVRDLARPLSCGYL